MAESFLLINGVDVINKPSFQAKRRRAAAAKKEQGPPKTQKSRCHFAILEKPLVVGLSGLLFFFSGCVVSKKRWSRELGTEK